MKKLLKTCPTIIVNLVLLAMLAAIVPLPAVAAPGDETTVGTLSLFSTFRNISVYAPFNGDNNHNNHAVMEYRLAGGSWRPGHELVVDRRSTIPESGGATNPFYNQWRGSIVGLEPDTAYEVRVTFQDGDGVTGTSPIFGSVTTLDEDIPLGTGTEYYVAKNGNDTTGDGSLGNPWLTIQNAVNHASTGDTIYIRGGTYNEEVTVGISGAPGNYITITGYASETAVIDAQNSRSYNIIIGNGSSRRDYINIKGLTIRNPRLTNILVRNGSSNIVIEDCIVEEPGSSSSGDSSNPVRGQAGIYIQRESANVIIRNNTITRTVGAAAGWPNSIDTVDAIYFYSDSYQSRGGGHIVCNNTIDGSTWWDGISGGSNFAITGMIYRDADIYDNYITGCVDDGIEIEGGDCNVRVWNNFLERDRVGIAFAAVVVGPLYIYRNTLHENGAAFKCGYQSHGQAYLYHNTSYSTGAGLQQTDYDLRSVRSRNNIIFTNGAPVYTSDIDASTMDFDYDDFRRMNTGYLVRWNSASYNTMSAFATATGQESHGISTDPLFTDPSGGEVTLQAASPCIDSGELIVGFNDADGPFGYQGSAPDIGAFEYDSGAPPNSPPVAANDSYTTDENTALSIAAPGVLTNDYDPDSDPLTAVLVNSPQHGTLTLQADGSFVYTPEDAYSGADSFTYRANDGHVNSGLATVTITVNNTVNRAPVLHPIGDKSVNEGETLSFTISADDPDGDSLTYSANNTPVGASFASATHRFSWTPASGQAGTYQNVRFTVSDSVLTDSESISITVSAGTSSPPLSGSMGGGGGGGVTGFTSVASSVTVSGEFLENITAISADDKVKLEIPKGTIGLNVLGQALRYISVKARDPQSAPPPDGQVIGLAYDIKPIGTTFEPSVNIIIRYSDAALSEGVAEKNLTVARYDEDTGQWEDYPSNVDETGNTVTAGIDTAATFAVLAYTHPGSFHISALAVIPQEVGPGEEVTISSSVVNAGDLTGDYEVVLKLDGEIIATQTVTLDGGAQETLSFTIKPVAPGEHQISIGDKLAIISVKSPPLPAAFSVSDLSISSREIAAGDGVMIRAQVVNTGELPGSFQVSLRLNGSVAATKTVTLDGGAGEEVVFNVSPSISGPYYVDINGLSGSFKVATPPEPPTAPSVERFSVVPEYDAASGTISSLIITFELNQPYTSFSNAGPVLNVLLDDRPLETIDILALGQLQPDGTGTLSYIPSLGWEAGTYTFRIGSSDSDGSARGLLQDEFTLVPSTETGPDSWFSKGIIIIGATLIVILSVVIIFLYRRWHMLRS